MTARGALAALATLLLAWGFWTAAAWIVGSFGLPYAALLQQAVLFILALSACERVFARFAPPGEPHG